MKFQEWMLDKRVIRQNLRRGAVSRADYQGYLASLPDVGGNLEHDDPAEWGVRQAAGVEEPAEGEEPEGGGGE